MKTGDIVNSGIVDNWGYIYNAYYTVFLVDKKTEYREAVIKPFKNLSQKYHIFNWEGGSSDGFADAIESGINLFNRENDEGLSNWIDSEIKVMWSLQDSSFQSRAQDWKGMGIIEGWHGDGNFARTTLMYCLWKTMGISLDPWREDLFFGACDEGNSLYIVLKANNDWDGRLIFGQKRYKKILNLPIDYPRINQFPEWFTLDPEKNYRLHDTDRKTPGRLSGKDLEQGLKIDLKKDQEYLIKISVTADR